MHTGGHPGFEQLRRASQVCSSWRSFILDSPLLWARPLELQQLLLKPVHWRDEVLRRTQTSPLHVKASLDGFLRYERDMKAMIVSLWDRIESLDFRFASQEQQRRASLEEWNALVLSPSTCLRHLKLFCPPSLPRFLDQISSSPMPFIETLELMDVRDALPAGGNIGATIHLPLLKHLRIDSVTPYNAPRALKILKRLENISTSDRCTSNLSLHILQSDFSHQVELASAISQTFAKYLRSAEDVLATAFEEQATACLTFTQNNVYFSVRPWMGSILKSSEETIFAFNIYSAWTDEFIAAFASCLESRLSRFDKLANLWFIMDEPDKFEEETIIAMMGIIPRLSSITSILTSRGALELLTKYQQTTRGAALPSIRDLCILDSTPTRDQALEAFLKSRSKDVRSNHIKTVFVPATLS